MYVFLVKVSTSGGLGQEWTAVPQGMCVFRIRPYCQTAFQAGYAIHTPIGGAREF